MLSEKFESDEVDGFVTHYDAMPAEWIGVEHRSQLELARQGNCRVEPPSGHILRSGLCRVCDRCHAWVVQL